MYILSIDPDTCKSGLAIFNTDEHSITLSSHTFWDVLYHIDQLIAVVGIANVRICIEAGHRTKTNFHISMADTKRTAAKKHYEVGRCHQIGILLVDYCHTHGYPYEEVFPLEKHWKGTDRKITHQELIDQLTKQGISFDGSKLNRSNQEERDAALIAITRPEAHQAYNKFLLSKL